MKTATPAVIAAEFSRRLGEVVGAKKLARIHKLNRAEVNRNICHSHDFCDANVVMDDAFLAVTGRRATDTGGEGVGCMSLADEAIWNAAWAIFRRPL